MVVVKGGAIMRPFAGMKSKTAACLCRRFSLQTPDDALRQGHGVRLMRPRVLFENKTGGVYECRWQPFSDAGKAVRTGHSGAAVSGNNFTTCLSVMTGAQSQSAGNHR